MSQYSALLTFWYIQLHGFGRSLVYSSRWRFISVTELVLYFLCTVYVQLSFEIMMCVSVNRTTAQPPTPIVQNLTAVCVCVCAPTLQTSWRIQQCHVKATVCDPPSCSQSSSFPSSIKISCGFINKISSI